MLKTILKFTGAAAVIALLCVLYGFLIEPKTLRITSLDVTPPNYDGAPLRVGLIADLHIGGRHVSSKRVAEIVEQMNALNPDIILLAGDYVNDSRKRAEQTAVFNSELDKGLKALGGLSAPKGVYAVIGNHDVMYGADHIALGLRREAISVLSNEALNKDNLCIVGFADHDTQQEDISASEGCEEGATILSVMHSPDSFEYMRKDSALAVAGHTHGGQINLPIIGRAVTSTSAGKPYAYGLKNYLGVPVFITSGIGTSIITARFRSPPEIVLMSLKP